MNMLSGQNMNVILSTSAVELYRRLLPQEHFAGSTVGILIKCVHLEVMLIGSGSLWLDV